MEQKKSKVTGIIFDKSGQGKNGVWYSFTIGFENGDSGKYFANSNPQTYFKNGEEAEYMKEVTQNGQYTNTKISPIRAQGGKQFFGGSPTAQNKRTALECAVSLAVAGKLPTEQIGVQAIKFATWLNSETEQKQPAPQPPPPTQEPDDSNSDLPF